MKGPFFGGPLVSLKGSLVFPQGDPSITRFKIQKTIQNQINFVAGCRFAGRGSSQFQILFTLQQT